MAATGVYNCTVTATNSLGTSLPSAPFFAFLGGQGTCTELPTAPTRLSTAPGDASATVSWAPATGSCIAGYVVTPYLAGVAQTSTIIPGQGTTTVVGNLLNGVTYTFTVSAENGITVGPASDPDRADHGRSRIGGRRPTGHKSRQGHAQDRIQCTGQQWRAHHELHRAVHVERPRRDRVKSGKAGPLTVSRLTAGKTYTCTVTATNGRGPGPVSPRSRPVTV